MSLEAPREYLTPDEAELTATWCGKPRSVVVKGTTITIGIGNAQCRLEDTTTQGRRPRCALPMVGLRSAVQTCHGRASLFTPSPAITCRHAPFADLGEILAPALRIGGKAVVGFEHPDLLMINEEPVDHLVRCGSAELLGCQRTDSARSPRQRPVACTRPPGNGMPSTAQSHAINQVTSVIIPPTMAGMEEVEVVVAHSERATLRVGDVFLKIDADQARADAKVEAMALAPIPTPEILWRKPPVLALAASPGRHSAASASRRRRRRRRGPRPVPQCG